MDREDVLSASCLFMWTGKEMREILAINNFGILTVAISYHSRIHGGPQTVVMTHEQNLLRLELSFTESHLDTV